VGTENAEPDGEQRTPVHWRQEAFGSSQPTLKLRWIKNQRRWAGNEKSAGRTALERKSLRVKDSTNYRIVKTY
jgi:hypothetical protein